MPEREPRDAAPGTPRPGFDTELDLRSIWGFGIGLALTMLLVLAIVWGMLARFKTTLVARDPRPSPMPEANEPRLPPGPRLQVSETLDMVALRQEEDAVLGSYGWVDKEKGIGRIPIQRAKEILLLTGLPKVVAPVAPAAAVIEPGAARGAAKEAAPNRRPRARAPRRKP